MRCRILAGVLAVFTGVTGVADETSPPPVRPLNELPMEQLRVMLRGFSGDWRVDTDRARGLPEPPAIKPVPDGMRRIPLDLPTRLTLDPVPFTQLLERRRSRRAFSPEPLTRQELSFLLWAGQGISQPAPDASLRTAPSGGGRYPLETYIFVNRVVDLPPGLYRYLPHPHQLAVLDDRAALTTELKTACYGQSSIGQAAVVLAWSAIPCRTEWKYGYIGHRMIAMEAGHACQNVYLAAETAGLGACALLGYDQSRLDRLTGLDGRDEFVIYLAAVGRRIPTP